MNKRGLTLIEVIIAISIFTVAAMIASTVLIKVVKLQKTSAIHNMLYSDLRGILQQLSSEIRAGAIDYDEYYNICVVQNACKGGIENDGYYGINYGVYGSRFYDPGNRGDGGVGGIAHNPADLGVECNYPVPLNGKECEIIDPLTIDFNVGQHPFPTGAQNQASAFCDKNVDRGLCNLVGQTAAVEQLFLIDKTGTKKTIIGKKKISPNGDYAIGIVKMEGQDMDQNGFTDVFSCLPEYNCFGNKTGEAGTLATAIKYPFVDEQYVSTNGIRVPQVKDLETPFSKAIASSQFVPISPLRSNIIDLKFIINPIEDPYKGYAEREQKSHPSVTIVLKVGLSESAASEYPGTFEPIVVQTTVAAGVNEIIESYPSINEIRENSNDPSWIENVLQPISIQNPL